MVPWDPEAAGRLGMGNGEVRVPRVPAVTGRNGQDCRLGPPESVGIPRTHAFGRERPKDGFGTTIGALSMVSQGKDPRAPRDRIQQAGSFMT